MIYFYFYIYLIGLRAVFTPVLQHFVNVGDNSPCTAVRVARLTPLGNCLRAWFVGDHKKYTSQYMRKHSLVRKGE